MKPSSHILGLLGLIFWITPSNALAAGADSLRDDSELYACDYGRSSFPENFAFKDGRKDAMIEIAWSFYVLRTGSEVTLIDTGFSDDELAAKWHLKNYTKPAEILRNLSVDPAAVNRVVITHLHFDHLNDLALFKHARVVMSRQDRDDYLSKKPMGGTVYREDVAAILHDETRTHVVDKTETLEGGMIFEVVGGHTRGSSAVYLHHRNVTYALTGDECYLGVSVRERRTIGIAVDQQANADFLRRVSEMGAVVLPCHDPLIFSGYPTYKPNVARIF